MVIVGCIIALYFQWQEQPPNLSEINQLLMKLPWYTIPLMILMSTANWLVESKKWQYLMRGVYGIRFRESVLQNLTSQAASFITPLKSGEFVAKALYFPQSLRKQIIQRVFLGNYCQMMITILLGIIGVFLSDFFYLELSFFMIIATILAMIIIISLYLWLSKRNHLDSIARAIWLRTLGYSFIRYLFFSINWLIILYGLSYGEPVLQTIAAVTVTYLVISIMPLIQLLDMPARLLVATTLFTGNADIVILSTSIVWVTNTVFPTLLGCALLPFKSTRQLKTA